MREKPTYYNPHHSTACKAQQLTPSFRLLVKALHIPRESKAISDDDGLLRFKWDKHAE